MSWITLENFDQDFQNKPVHKKEKYMKKLLQIGAVLFGLIMSANVSAMSANVSAYDNNTINVSGDCCPPEQPCEQPVNDCYCKYVRYKPCYYTVNRCIEEQVPCQRQCCRYVPKYYQVQRCRYVPQYYCETCCR